MKESGLYIHIPFCRNKCIYCDFFSGGYNLADWDALVDALLSELAQRKHELASVPDTLYIGGGTPSLLPAEAFERLVNGLCEILGKFEPWKEFTIEVNPEDVDDDKCDVWKTCGVNRVSMGVQSFIDSELKAVKRRHDSICACEAFGRLSEYFENISIDLMFGLPGQTIESWAVSIERALKLSPTHISAYSLMFEDGTPITVLKKYGKLEFPTEETCVKMWEMLSTRLKDSGYIQYEISNYCKPGCESVHNSRYWLGNPYLGLGPSAHSYDGLKTRRANPTDLKGYMRYFIGADLKRSFCVEEVLTEEEIIEEVLLTRMRMRAGIDLTEFESRFGKKEIARLIKNAEPFILNGSLLYLNNRLILSDNGIMIADDVILGLSI